MPELDGLRAISILMVITAHLGDGVWHWFNGGFGVTVFFVLSGYLITMLALREEEQRGRLDIRAFYTRRVFRIFPLYYLVLAGYVVLILGLKVAPEKITGFAPSLPFFVFYFPEVAAHMGPHGAALPFYQAWSLGIEEKFYFIWPTLAFLILRGKTRPRLTVTVLLIIVFVFNIYWAPGLGILRLQSYAHILFGALLAILLEQPSGFALIQRLCCRISLVCLLGLATLQFSRLPSMYPQYVSSAYAFLVMSLLAAVLTSKGWMNQALSLKPLVFIGKISYGMYLVHILCLNIVEKFVHPSKGLALFTYVVTCCVTILAAWVLHVTVEQPMIELGKRSLLRRDSSAVSTPRQSALPVPD